MDSLQSFEGIESSVRFLPRRFAIRTEIIVYAVIVLLALILRIAQLDVVPLTTHEARQALAAWRVVNPVASGATIVPESPLLFAIHYLSFSVLGVNEFSTRILTVVASILLVLSPLLFVALFGKLRTLVIVVLLAFSPILMATSRMDSPVIWSMLFSIVVLWGIWQYYLHGYPKYAVCATVSTAVVVFLADPAGIIVIVTIGIALLFLLWYKRRSIELEPLHLGIAPAGHWESWPWKYALAIALLVIFLVSTLFMLYPSGISSVGELVRSGLQGLTTARAFYPPFMAVLTVLYYEPLLVIMGLVSIVIAVNNDELGWEDRFLVAWLLIAVAAAFLYAGTGPEHALWVLFPLTGLTSRVVSNLVVGGDRLFSRIGSRWLVAIIVAALLAMISVHAQSIARALMTSPDTQLQTVNINPQNVIGIIIALLLILIGYFLASSEWSEGVTVRGGVLGILIFSILTGVGTGWQIAVNNSENAVEFWNRNPTSLQTILLRETLLELADRESSGFPETAITAMAPDDGIVAWLLRDFTNAIFVNYVTAAKGQGIVLLPSSYTEPDLGGAYVGTTVSITNSWEYRSISVLSFPAWWLQRRTLTSDLPSDAMTLWLRQDIYNGVEQPGE